MQLQPFQAQDEAIYCKMAWDFHNGPASAATPSVDNFKRTFAHALKADDTRGWLITDNGEVAGYILCAKMFSTEIGGWQVWLEDLSISENFQGRGLGTQVIEAVMAHFPEAMRFRLEITPANLSAKRLYHRLGFADLPYLQMVKDFPPSC